MRFSIIVVCLNAGERLKETIESILIKFSTTSRTFVFSSSVSSTFLCPIKHTFFTITKLRKYYSILKQTYSDYEVIIKDGLSKDGSIDELLKKNEVASRYTLCEEGKKVAYQKTWIKL